MQVSSGCSKLECLIVTGFAVVFSKIFIHRKKIRDPFVIVRLLLSTKEKTIFNLAITQEFKGIFNLETVSDLDPNY